MDIEFGRRTLAPLGRAGFAFMTRRAMQEATFLILTALAAGSQHGYGIITDVRHGRVRLLAGTLYTALERARLNLAGGTI
jgi:hypothetical protein